MLTYDYKCTDCGATEEHLVKDSSTMFVTCKVCGEAGAVRQLAAPRSKLDGSDPGFPDAYDKWAKQHEKAGHPIEGHIGQRLP